jgi:hypothetical protein
MFKKSKLASAVVVALAATVAVSPSVLAQNAGAVLGTVVKYSPEGQGSSTTIDSAVSLFTLGQDLIVNDEVWLTASAALNAATEFPSTLVTCSLDDDTDNVITLTRYSNTTTLGKYRLTAKTDGTTDGTKNAVAACATAAGGPVQTEDGGNTALTLVGAVVQIPALTTPWTVAADLSVGMATKTSGGSTIDSDTSATPLDWIADELTASVTTVLNGKIDVDQAQKELTAATDVMVTTYVDNGGGATYATSTIKLSGDWSWMDSDTTTAGMQLAALTHGTATHAVTSGSAAAIANSQFNAAMTTWSIPVTLTAANVVTTTITPDATNTGGVIPEQTFTYEIDSLYDHPGTTDVAEEQAAAGSAAGSWSKNNASITAYSVPMSSGVTRMLWVSNTGAKSAVTASVRADGVTYGPYAMGDAGLNANLAIGQTLDTALAADAAWVAAGYTSRADIIMTVATSSANVNVSAGYYSTGDKDRQHLETSASLD